MTWTCLLCQQNSFEKVALHVRDSYDHGIVKCSTCGHVQLNPVPSEDELAEYYRNETQRKSVHGHMTREQKRLHVKADTDRRIALIDTLGFTEKPYILDWGCGQGFFVDEMQFNGYNISGTDYGKKVALHHSGERFGVITSFHVLEHWSSRPIYFLCAMYQQLKDCGYLIIEVPNHDDWLIAACPEYRAWHYQRAHIHYFTPRTLLSVVNQSGIQYRNLRLFGVQRYSEWDSMKWLQDGKPDMTAVIGASGFSENKEQEYRLLRKSTLTSDTLCLILQK